MIHQGTFQFLKDLEINNNREWFNQHKDQYHTAKENVLSFMQTLENELNKNDVIEKQHLFRIYRDVRFSKDKTPYKERFGGYFSRAGAERRGSYYFQINPDEVIVGGGFYGPEPKDLLRIRKEFELDISSIEKIVQDKTFQSFFGKIQGEEVKTAPKGFSKDHPNIHWIRKKHLYAFRHFTPEKAQKQNFAEQTIQTFEALRPFFDFMSDILTTDLNGESLLNH